MNFLGIFVFVSICFQIRDTAHTKGIGSSVVVLIEIAIVQVAVIVCRTALNRAWPYEARLAVVIRRARAACRPVALQGAVTWIEVTELVCRFLFTS